MIIVRVTETKRVANMPSDWYKVTGQDQRGREYQIDESHIPYTLNTGEYIKCRELDKGKVMALEVVEGF